jgi:hypothetical protein
MLVHRATNTISVAVDGHRGRVLLLGWGNPLGAAALPRANDGTDTVHLLTHPGGRPQPAASLPTNRSSRWRLNEKSRLRLSWVQNVLSTHALYSSRAARLGRPKFC